MQAAQAFGVAFKLDDTTLERSTQLIAVGLDPRPAATVREVVIENTEDFARVNRLATLTGRTSQGSECTTGCRPVGCRGRRIRRIATGNAPITFHKS